MTAEELDAYLNTNLTRTGEALVEFVDPGGYYNADDAAYVHHLYLVARGFVDAVEALGYIPVHLKRKTATYPSTADPYPSTGGMDGRGEMD